MKLDRILTSFEESLKEFNIKANLGGSYALNKVYGILERMPDDVDVILSAPQNFKEENQEKVYTKIMELFPLSEVIDLNNHKYADGSVYPINLKIKAVIEGFNGAEKTCYLNILMASKFNYNDFNSKMVWNGMRINTLNSILKAKGAFGREKEAVDFFLMNRKLNSFCTYNDLPF